MNIQLGTPEVISKSQTERLIMANIAFMQVARLFGTAFYVKLEKHTKAALFQM